jgi:GNAT superfamily N-acetyltransferase
MFLYNSENFSFYRILSSQDQYFVSSWDLYCSSFPEEERRSLDNLSNVLGNSLFHADIIFQEEHFIGLLFWWNFEDFRYIEHFAICPENRGQGLGSLILNHFNIQSSLPVLLEVEPGDTDLAKRRIQFYESNHFHLHTFPYIQPPYNLDTKSIPLQIMSYPRPLPIDIFNAFVKTIHQKVYQYFKN